MATPPRDLQVGTPPELAYQIINENFRNAVATVADLGAAVTGQATFTFTIPASSLQSFVVAVVSKGTVCSAPYQVTTTSPAQTLSGIAPQMSLYVDTDNDSNFKFPLGASLTSGQLSVFPLITQMDTPYLNSVGAFLVQINNRDSGSHTYYAHVQAGYFPLLNSQFR